MRCGKIFCSLLVLFAALGGKAQEINKGTLIYSNTLSSKDSMTNWVMDGQGVTEYKDGWMQMYSPGEKGHHVLWCPQEFPENFVAEWEVKNLHTAAGLCIVFFAAKGIHDEDIFSPSLPKRDGKFKDYIKGKIRNYHISYYANAKNEHGRETANLRKNPGFHLVQEGEAGIPISSIDTYKIQLLKQDNHIRLTIDGRKVIDWQDNEKAWGSGKIGFRQMKWTRFAYRNVKVWSIGQK